MATFSITKYEETPQEKKITETVSTTPEANIDVVGSISEIVAKALNNTLAFRDKNDVVVNVRNGSSSVTDNRNKPSEEKDDDKTTTVTAITTEDINNNPIDTFKSIPKNSIVYIQNEGFTTAKEEWFLSNVTPTHEVFFSKKSLINRLLK